MRNLAPIVLHIFTYLIHPPVRKSPPTAATAHPPPLHRCSPHPHPAPLSGHHHHWSLPWDPLLTSSSSDPGARRPPASVQMPSPWLGCHPPPPCPQLTYSGPNTSHTPRRARLMVVGGRLSTHLPLAKIKRITGNLASECERAV